MPRGRRKVVTGPGTIDVNSLEQELIALKQRQLEVRQQLRRVKNSQSEIGKLEEKLSGQLATAKWTVGQILQLDDKWDEIGFYNSVAAKQPAPRGRRRKVVAEA
jgi:hypothetical protein